MEKESLFFDGNEKQFFQTDDPEQVIIHFKDAITAFGNVKKAALADKGKVNCSISSLIFDFLKKNGIDTHYIARVGEREQLCRKISIIPLEVIVYNYISGPLSVKLGLEEGMKPGSTIYDLRYNNAELGDPIINASQAVALGLLNKEEIESILDTAKQINSLLFAVFEKAGLKLVDMKLEFGRASTGEIILSDEISPDTCRIWDAETDEKLDKDRFRFDLGYIVASYSKVYEKLSKVLE